MNFRDLIDTGVINNKEFMTKYMKNINLQSEWTKAIKSNDLEVIKLLLSPEYRVNSTPSNNNYELTKASEKGHLEVVKLLIEHGADVNHNKGHSLQLASKYNRLEVVKLLIKHGADVKVDNNLAIRWASGNGHIEVVKVLLEHGADVKAQYNDAIKQASQNGHLEVVKLLIEHGADVKVDNNLAIRWASEKGHLEVVKLLIEHGADIEIALNSNPSTEIKEYLLSIKNQTYFGIVSDGKLDIKLPDLLEIIKNNKYYYVYKCQSVNGGYLVNDHSDKYNILSSLNRGQVLFFSTI